MRRSEAALLVLASLSACASETGHDGGGGASSSASGFFDVGAGGSLDCHDGSGGASAAVCDAAAPPRTFEVDVEPLLASCAGESCHSGMPYDRLVGFASVECTTRLLVTAGEPGASYLVDKLRGDRLCCGERMPLGQEPMPKEDIQTIVDWICQGAPPQ